MMPIMERVEVHEIRLSCCSSFAEFSPMGRASCVHMVGQVWWGHVVGSHSETHMVRSVQQKETPGVDHVRCVCTCCRRNLCELPSAKQMIVTWAAVHPQHLIYVHAL